MTDSFGTIDAVLWSVAVALLAGAIWLTRRDRPSWDPAVWFGGVLRAALPEGPFPLREGPVPAEGWEGKPEELEPSYDPKERLGAEVSWDDVRGGSAPFSAALTRRDAGVTLVWIEPPTIAIEGLEPVVLTDEAGILARLPRPEDRLVLAAGPEADRALRLLHASPRLRDRLRAVVLVRPKLDRDWLEANFNHASFEVEVSREVPYFTLRAGADAADQRLPDPRLPRSGIRSMVVVDLGVLPVEILGGAATGRALGALIASLA